MNLDNIFAANYNAEKVSKIMKDSAK